MSEHEDLPATVLQFTAHNDELIPADSTPPMSIYGDAALFSGYFENEKTFVKLVKKAVQYCRRSPEYRRYTKFLAENLNMGTCFLAQNLDEGEAKRGGLEIHHYPLTIFDICELVIIKRKMLKERFTLFAVANEVMRLHYQNRVGLVPLLETYHQAAHAGSLYIPPAVIFGKWIELLEEYKEFLQEKHIDKMREIVNMHSNEGVMLQRLAVTTRVKPTQWIERIDDYGALMSSQTDVLASGIITNVATEDGLEVFLD